MDVVTLAHGSGGSLTGALINDLFRRHFENPYLTEAHDAARLPVITGRPAFTTDSYVISPLQFPGGNIGKLAVCGTVNDLAVGGARPLWLSAAFIIEEGCEVELLHRVVGSMAREAARRSTSNGRTGMTVNSPTAASSALTRASLPRPRCRTR